ncbi:hypothetical protein BGW36DRAFT_299313 [Talaromyces proteolyticus]|uniref:U4/U6.U5 small nuclear ribonucleoprotein 27kDa protein domain-containing protein n=1 Tax=Talaromyces proteolyticus TaxID=1131652 RepID=A0AAD4PWI0_9EURO|nr:uncharacterized protein BGW36DRAFT_299313 [Talaromyces proteolyticus]KAH8695110.1 hypothetical protein BGW36DRAFT_299313 [Talaromyces proteolyticus]
MAEPPAKRARRTDSSAMWDRNDQRPRESRSPEGRSDYDTNSRHGSSRPEDSRKGSRDDRRYRSRSRDRTARRRDGSRSRDRYERTRRGDRDVGRRDLKDSRGFRDRERSVSADRYQGRRGYGAKSERHDRSRSPRNGARVRSRSPISRSSKGGRRDDRQDPRGRPDGRRVNGVSGKQARVRDEDEDENDVDLMDESEDPNDIEAMMRKTVGFTRFRTTKNTKIPGNNIYGVRKEKKTEYRQYMNRVGGFNRPLSPGR